jgi:transposase
MTASAAPRLVHRTAHIRLRVTRWQARRCYGLLRSAGDVWAWLLDSNRQRRQQGEPAISNYQALCRELAKSDGFGELSTVGARSVLKRYSDAWFQAATRRGQAETAGFPRRKRALVPVRYYHGTFLHKAELAGMVVRLVDERATSSTCPACRQRVAKPTGRGFHCRHCGLQGHRDLVGARNIAAKAGGGPTSVGLPTLVEHRRAGILPARRDRRRHLDDQRRRRSCLASGHPPDDPASGGCRSPRVPDLTHGEDHATPPNRANVA